MRKKRISIVESHVIGFKHLTEVATGTITISEHINVSVSELICFFILMNHDLSS
jgi:hypothetical protein